MTNLPDRLMLPALSACLLKPLRSTNFTVTTLDLFLLFTPAPLLHWSRRLAPSDPSSHQGVDPTGTLRLSRCLLFNCCRRRQSPRRSGNRYPSSHSRRVWQLYLYDAKMNVRPSTGHSLLARPSSSVIPREWTQWRGGMPAGTSPHTPGRRGVRSLAHGSNHMVWGCFGRVSCPCTPRFHTKALPGIKKPAVMRARFAVLKVPASKPSILAAEERAPAAARAGERAPRHRLH